MILAMIFSRYCVTGMMFSVWNYSSMFSRWPVKCRKFHVAHKKLINGHDQSWPSPWLNQTISLEITLVEAGSSIGLPKNPYRLPTGERPLTGQMPFMSTNQQRQTTMLILIARFQGNLSKSAITWNHLQFVWLGGRVAINRSRARILASPLSIATLGKLLTHMCLCHQAV